MNSFTKILIAFACSVWFFASCTRDPNDQGTEFAPQMYLSGSYEPYTQVEGPEGKHKYNPMGINMREPAKNTIARRRFNTKFEIKDSTGTNYKTDIMEYNLHKDSIQYAERVLRNPFPASKEVLEEGKLLYTRYCSPCHGEQGDGKGKVADMYKGVPNYTAAAYKNLNGGHIYHVITFGKGRMWPHGTQLNSDERWKVVHYVHTLQKPAGSEEAEEKKEEKTENKTEVKKDSVKAK